MHCTVCINWTASARRQTVWEWHVAGVVFGSDAAVHLGQRSSRAGATLFAVLAVIAALAGLAAEWWRSRSDAPDFAELLEES